MPMGRRTWMSIINNLWKEETAQGLAEYGMLMMLTVIVVIVAITFLGATIHDVFWQSSLVDLGL